MKLQIVKLPSNGERLVITGDTGRIVSESDCVHEVNPETVVYTVTKEKIEGDKTYLTFNDIELPVAEFLAFPSVEIQAEHLTRWISYFGIKYRIAANYRLLQKSCKEIGAKVDWPIWE